MRCSECDRIITDPCVGRLKDGRLVFGWCRACLEVADGVFVEISPRVRLFGEGRHVVVPMGGTSWESGEARSRQRFLAIGTLAAVLVFWGLTLVIAGFARTDEPTPLNPNGSGQANLLIASGGCLIGTALGLVFAVWRARKKGLNDWGNAIRPTKSYAANGPALLGLGLLIWAASRADARISAVSVLFAAPLVLSSWFWMNRQQKPDERSYGCHSELLEV